jgi:endoglucanase
MLTVRPIGGFLAAMLAALLAATPALAADVPPPALAHGVNLSNWFADMQRDPLVENDFQVIKAAGFDHVRIPINPESLGFSLYDAESGRVLFDFTGLDSAIDIARQKGLSVILDIQPSESFMASVEQDPHAEGGLIALWQHMAEHFKIYSTQTVVFELLGEPRASADPAQYRSMVGDIVVAIRQISPKSTIIVDVPKNASLEGFDGFAAVSADNVLYAFHFYEPWILTHSGMKVPPAKGRSLRYFRNLPYPSQQADVNGNYFPDAPDVQEAKRALTDYVNANWDAVHIAARIRVAADWAKANHQPVMCTEFGAARRFLSPPVRYQWIADTRKALDAAGIGWDLWDYTDLFGITRLTGETVTESSDGLVHLADPQSGSRDVEAEAVKALFGG